MRKVFLVVLAVASISIILNFFLFYKLKNINKDKYKVIEVLDGDTFKIEKGRRVRIMGVNAPELGRCLSDKAKEKLSSLILGKEVILKDQFTDPYGRIMANVFVGDKYINKEILLAGLGRMDYYENPKKEELKKAYEEARKNKRGIFSGVCWSLFPNNSCNIKGNIDDNTKKKYYYLPTCKNYSQVVIDLSTDEKFFCNEEEAIKEGFKKSSTCF